MSVEFIGTKIRFPVLPRYKFIAIFIIRFNVFTSTIWKNIWYIWFLKLPYSQEHDFQNLIYSTDAKIDVIVSDPPVNKWLSSGSSAQYRLSILISLPFLLMPSYISYSNYLHILNEIWLSFTVRCQYLPKIKK